MILANQNIKHRQIVMTNTKTILSDRVWFHKQEVLLMNSFLEENQTLLFL